MENNSAGAGRHVSVWSEEKALWVGLVSMALAWTVGAGWFKGLAGGVVAAGLFVWIFPVMLALSFRVVHHAECLAVRLGEPLGTLILTLAVITIEVVVIAAVMFNAGENPTMARDTMFSVVMLVLNGVLGVTLLAGGLRHREQGYNLRGARSYMSVLFALGLLTMVLPRLVESAPGGGVSPVMGGFFIVASLALYGTFLLLQATRHRTFFTQEEDEKQESVEVAAEVHAAPANLRSLGYHCGLLLLAMLPIVLLSKKLAVVVEFGIAQVNAPHALAGFLVATLVLAPEALAALRAAMANQLQRTVNIALGSALATIGLTVPTVFALGYLSGMRVEMGLEPPEILLLVTTFLVTLVNFGGVRTNTLGGLTHLVLLAGYVVLIFDR
jgi:Ca2+:H+ antiporter